MGSSQNHTLKHVAITGTDKCGPIQMNPIHSLIFRRPTNQERAFLPPVIWTGRWSALAGPRTNLTVRTGRPAHLLLTDTHTHTDNRMETEYPIRALAFDMSGPISVRNYYS